MLDRRRIPRVQVFFLLENMTFSGSEGGMECQGVVKNITPDGLLLESNVKIKKNDILQLSFTLPNTRKALNLEGKVRWAEVKKAYTTAGIEFMDLTSEQREVIMEYLMTLGFSL
ncbi:PilZ domain-containing protein [candidate division FCPU426 bacterium]|nr:PilZ domain-containing protein [candidate division FCPU426 bacterium]